VAAQDAPDPVVREEQRSRVVPGVARCAALRRGRPARVRPRRREASCRGWPRLERGGLGLLPRGGAARGQPRRGRRRHGRRRRATGGRAAGGERGPRRLAGEGRLGGQDRGDCGRAVGGRAVTGGPVTGGIDAGGAGRLVRRRRGGRRRGSGGAACARGHGPARGRPTLRGVSTPTSARGGRSSPRAAPPRSPRPGP
jgi:hypothetical protein